MKQSISENPILDGIIKAEPYDNNLEGFSRERTFSEVVEEDSIDTVLTLGELYIPNFDPQLEKQKIRQDIEKIMNPNNQREELVDLQLNYANSLERITNGLEFANIHSDNLVAPNPKSPKFKNFLRKLTVETFEKLKYHINENRPFNKETTSQTRTLSMINEFYQSNGVRNREEAKDLIIGEILFYYYSKLNTLASKEQ